MKEVRIIVILISVLQAATCARILGVFPFPSISHQIVFRELMTELARRGHEVTVITPDPMANTGLPETRFKQIDVHNLSYTLWSESFQNLAKIRDISNRPLDLYPAVKETMISLFDAQMKSPDVKALLDDSTQKFDLLFVESLVVESFAFAWRFKAPYIGVISLSGTITDYESAGNPTHPVLYPDFYRQKATLSSIWDKINVLYDYCFVRFYDYWFEEEEDSVVRKHFGADCPPLHVLQSNKDLQFMNTHPILFGIRPTVPSIVYIGGIHLKPKKKLPDDLQTFLDTSGEGVVYISLGTNVKSKDLPPETLSMFLDVFRELPYKVLWKFESDFPNLPRNVKTSKWLPQQDLMGHPNIKVFITQGGLQSMDEAIRDKVPLIGIPFIGDQDLNIQNAVRHGIGVGLNINTLTKEEFNKTILSVAQDPKYKKAMVRLSALLSDQPMSSLERAVWWTEYVLRHGGARHLRAPAAGMSAREYFMLDVVAVVASFAVIVAFLLTLLSKRIFLVLSTSAKLKKN